MRGRLTALWRPTSDKRINKASQSASLNHQWWTASMSTKTKKLDNYHSVGIEDNGHGNCSVENILKTPNINHKSVAERTRILMLSNQRNHLDRKSMRFPTLQTSTPVNRSHSKYPKRFNIGIMMRHQLMEATVSKTQSPYGQEWGARMDGPSNIFQQIAKSWKMTQQQWRRKEIIFLALLITAMLWTGVYILFCHPSDSTMENSDTQLYIG